MHISSIHIYPVKSCAAIDLTSSNVELNGLEFDRQWMLYSKSKGFLTQRQLPQMATIKTAIAGNELILDAQNMPALNLPINGMQNVKELSVKVWKREMSALDQGDEAAAWLNKYLATEDVSLLRTKPSEHFVDSRPILVISQASLNDLNSRLTKSIPMSRFRPNLVLENSQAYEEDILKTITINKTVLENSKPCTRCVITTTDQKSGIKTGTEPLKTLNSYRKTPKGIIFGQYFTVQMPGKIKVNDNVST